MKAWLPLTLLVGLVGGLAWAQPSQPLPAGPSPTPTVLRFVSWKPDHPAVWEEAIARFTKAYPHISVVREIAPHSSTAYHDLLTQKLKNRDATVDLFFMDVIWVPEFAAAGWALPLDARFPAVERRDFLEATISAGTYQGHVYGIPTRIDGGMLYYRADLLEQYGFAPPRTWEALVEQAETILRGEAAAHPALRGYSGQFKQYEGLVCNMLEFIEGHGGELISEAHGRARLSSPEALAAVRFVRERIVRGIASRAVLTYQEPESLVAFIQGNAVFHRNWPYAWEVANNPRRSSVAGKVGVAPLPGFTQAQGVSALGGWLYGVSAYSTHPEEAWQFIAFLSGAEMQKQFAIQAGLAPSRTTLYRDPDVLAANPQFRDQFAMLAAARPRPRTAIYPAVSHVLQRYFSRALAMDNLDIAKESAVADREIDRLLTLTQEFR